MTSPPDPVYDVAILGAGVSGLALAWELCDSRVADRSILLVDGARDDGELRTLSFWAEGPTALEPLVRHRWDTLRLRLGASSATVRLHEYSYRTLYFADLQRETKARLAARPQHRVVEGRVRSLEEDGDGVTITVGEVSHRARFAFDSRFHLSDLEVDGRRHHLLRQHFHGWVVRAPRDVFEPEAATLFDFRVERPPGTAFFYVLPRSRREALVELVSLDPVDAEPLLRAYLREAFAVDDPEVLDHEAGVSPMTERPFPAQAGPRVRRLGIAAGRLKPSTGYALTRILDDAAAIVRRLEAGGDGQAPAAGSALYRLLDAVLLEVWEAEPAAIPPIFAALFLRNPGDLALRFLDERCGPLQILRLIAALPPAPFLRALARLLLRRLGRRALPSGPAASRALPPPRGP